MQGSISANTPDESAAKKLAAFTASFISLDGIDEKGVSVSVLTLDSEPVRQNTGKPVIASNMQWSVTFNNTNLTAEIGIRRNWNDKTEFAVVKQLK